MLPKSMNPELSTLTNLFKEMAAAGWWLRLPNFGVKPHKQGRIYSAKQVLRLAQKPTLSYWEMKALGSAEVCFAN